ncbi:coiled-coil domain-containing protein 51-like [Tropilaelaps mercedesae]|uniref:Coiled-coil domain-containing protein 51-like n=1 Tax=Tropilaelaps mercedesae TaxID=418985 RepID=A0A1V9WZE7_9ACAR|nr:coiled-coil domain-containing protein 51-like [Tropilaelaps mercedesae]
MIRLWRLSNTVCEDAGRGVEIQLREWPCRVAQRRRCTQKCARSTNSVMPHADGAATLKLMMAKPRLEEKLNYVMKLYEDFIGLTEVKAAQAKVISAEFAVKEAQERRTSQQRRIRDLQRQLREIHVELDKTTRGEDRHLQLITKEHAILREERELQAEFRETEKREHSSFSLLSLALRESHEKERAQAEKTKYWSIIGSIMGTVIGIVATTINNQYRLHQLRKLVTDATCETAQCRDLILQTREVLNEQNTLLKETAGSAPSIAASLAGVDAEGVVTQGETHVPALPMDSLYEQVVHLEGVVRQTSLVNTALISALLVLVPVVGWMLSR